MTGGGSAALPPPGTISPPFLPLPPPPPRAPPPAAALHPLRAPRVNSSLPVFKRLQRWVPPTFGGLSAGRAPPCPSGSLSRQTAPPRRWVMLFVRPGHFVLIFMFIFVSFSPQFSVASPPPPPKRGSQTKEACCSPFVGGGGSGCVFVGDAGIPRSVSPKTSVLPAAGCTWRAARKRAISFSRRAAVSLLLGSVPFPSAYGDFFFFFFNLINFLKFHLLAFSFQRSEAHLWFLRTGKTRSRAFLVGLAVLRFFFFPFCL